MDLSNILPLLIAAALGASLAVVFGVPLLTKWQRDKKARTLRGMVKQAGELSKLEDDFDPVAAAKRKAEEAALLKQLAEAVAKLTPAA